MFESKVAKSKKLDLTWMELEDGILASGGTEENYFLADLLSRLLQGCYGRKDILHYNYQLYLKDILKHRWAVELNKASPLEDSDFRSLSLRTKVEIVHAICDYRLDVIDVPELLKGLDSDNLRVDPLGVDGSGATYWYFYGTRLYREDPLPEPPIQQPKKKKKGRPKRKKHTEKTKRGRRRKGRTKWTQGKQSKSTEESSSGCEQDCDKADEDGPSQKKEMAVVRWHLVCSSLEEWQQLANTFEESKVKCERQMYRALIEDFLPEIPKLMEEKEKEMRRKLMETAPRRISHRLGEKRASQGDEDLAGALVGEAGNTQLAELQRRQLEEIERQEEEKRQQEDKLRAKEGRNRRAHLREERARLIAEGKDIPPELLYADNPVITKNALHKERRRSVEPDDKMLHGMMKAIQTVRAHKSSWPFREPVQESFAPSYFDIIKHPMDLSSMEKKVKGKEYRSREEYFRDFRRMVTNCHRYNGPDSEYSAMAEEIERCFKKATKKYIPKEHKDRDEEFRATAVNSLQKSHRPSRAASSRALEALHQAAAEALQASSRSASSSSDESGDDNPSSNIKSGLVIKMVPFSGSNTNADGTLKPDGYNPDMMNSHNMADAYGNSQSMSQSTSNMADMRSCYASSGNPSNPQFSILQEPSGQQSYLMQRNFQRNPQTAAHPGIQRDGTRNYGASGAGQQVQYPYNSAMMSNDQQPNGHCGFMQSLQQQQQPAMSGNGTINRDTLSQLSFSSLNNQSQYNPIQPNGPLQGRFSGIRLPQNDNHGKVGSFQDISPATSPAPPGPGQPYPQQNYPQGPALGAQGRPSYPHLPNPARPLGPMAVGGQKPDMSHQFPGNNAGPTSNQAQRQPWMVQANPNIGQPHQGHIQSRAGHPPPLVPDGSQDGNWSVGNNSQLIHHGTSPSGNNMVPGQPMQQAQHQDGKPKPHLSSTAQKPGVPAGMGHMLPQQPAPRTSRVQALQKPPPGYSQRLPCPPLLHNKSPPKQKGGSAGAPMAGLAGGACESEKMPKPASDPFSLLRSNLRELEQKDKAKQAASQEVEAGANRKMDSESPTDTSSGESSDTQQSRLINQTKPQGNVIVLPGGGFQLRQPGAQGSIHEPGRTSSNPSSPAADFQQLLPGQANPINMNGGMPTAGSPGSDLSSLKQGENSSSGLPDGLQPKPDHTNDLHSFFEKDPDELDTSDEDESSPDESNDSQQDAKGLPMFAKPLDNSDPMGNTSVKSDDQKEQRKSPSDPINGSSQQPPANDAANSLFRLEQQNPGEHFVQQRDRSISPTMGLKQILPADFSATRGSKTADKDDCVVSSIRDPQKSNAVLYQLHQSHQPQLLMHPGAEKGKQPNDLLHPGMFDVRSSILEQTKLMARDENSPSTSLIPNHLPESTSSMGATDYGYNSIFEQPNLQPPKNEGNSTATRVPTDQSSDKDVPPVCQALQPPKKRKMHGNLEPEPQTPPSKIWRPGAHPNVGMEHLTGGHPMGHPLMMPGMPGVPMGYMPKSLDSQFSRKPEGIHNLPEDFHSQGICSASLQGSKYQNIKPKPPASDSQTNYTMKDRKDPVGSGMNALPPHPAMMGSAAKQALSLEHLKQAGNGVRNPMPKSASSNVSSSAGMTKATAHPIATSHLSLATSTHPTFVTMPGLGQQPHLFPQGHPGTPHPMAAMMGMQANPQMYHQYMLQQRQAEIEMQKHLHENGLMYQQQFMQNPLMAYNGYQFSPQMAAATQQKLLVPENSAQQRLLAHLAQAQANGLQQQYGHPGQTHRP